METIFEKSSPSDMAGAAVYVAGLIKAGVTFKIVNNGDLMIVVLTGGF